MSKTLKHHQHRNGQLSNFGKDLARRSHRKCELCASSGVSLSIYEVEPIPEEPELDHCLFLCDVCQTELKNLKRLNENHWHCLNHSIWSEIKVVQVMTCYLLHKINKEWCNDLLEQVYLEEESVEWIEKLLSMKPK